MATRTGTRIAISSIVAVLFTAAGLVGGLWAFGRLNTDGAWGPQGMAAGHLDFEAGAVLLVGVAFLITGVIIALAAVAQFWIEAQERRDIVVARRRAARAHAKAARKSRIAH